MNSFAACTICSNNARHLIYKSGIDLVQCVSCGLISMHPIPSPDFLQKLYSPAFNYHNEFSKDFVSSQRKEFNRRVAILRLPKNGRILDVGCADGLFLDCAKKHALNTFGVELNETTYKIAQQKGHLVFHGNFESYSSEMKFDAIHMGDVLEHERNPLISIEKAGLLLKDSGFLVISTPNFDSFFAKSTLAISKLLGISWSHPIPPYHIHQFSFSNLTKAMEIKGFKLEKIYFTRCKLWDELMELEYSKPIISFLKNRDGLFITFIKNSLLFFATSIVYVLLYWISIIVQLISKRSTGMVCFYKKIDP